MNRNQGGDMGILPTQILQPVNGAALQPVFVDIPVNGTIFLVCRVSLIANLPGCISALRRRYVKNRLKTVVVRLIHSNHID